MKEQEKQEYLEKYNEQKKKGVPFFPDVIFKDMLAALFVFILLLALAYFLGAPLEEKANPADTNYNPRPEWYFLFLFQLLKYFPGALEVLGVFVLPMLGILILFILPFIDRSPRRHPLSRPVVIIVTALVTVGVLFLSIQSSLEIPPPVVAEGGDQTAALYAANCAPCHGASIYIPPGTNLHEVIAQGKHEGMPVWSGDLTSDEIDALAGFILSPAGSNLFTNNCSACHDVSELVAGDSLELKNSLTQGEDYPPHIGVEAANWNEVMNQEERTSLLNFLVAPDGQRLFFVNCASCHGRSVAFSGGEGELRTLISEGGLHLEMPPWRERLDDSELDDLAEYVTDPNSTAEGEALFQQYCSSCHGERIPLSADVDQAREIIASGGSHQTMPVWGEVLTSEQMDALVNYTLEASMGGSLQEGQDLYAQNCAPCHGDFGEGGVNPARQDDIIAPISSVEYLKTRDDFTLRSIISQGQPNFGMSPFGTANGGPLDEDEIDAVVAYMRSWEQNPPVDQPPEITVSTVAPSGSEVYADVCAQCHGVDGGGLFGPPLSDPQYQAENSDEDIYNTINLGHEATAMIGWGEILSAEQIQQLVEFIRTLEAEGVEVDEPEAAPSRSPSFANDVLPIFDSKCAACHGHLGGWDGSSYEQAMNSGDNSPVVIPGDVDGSLLAQKLIGTHTEGTIMPPGGKLQEDLIEIILNWIAAGALDN
jgi:mono/diheme cytochrome c family protein